MSPSLLLVRYIDTKFHQNYSQTVRVYLGERVNSVVRPPQPTAMFEAAESYWDTHFAGSSSSQLTVCGSLLNTGVSGSGGPFDAGLWEVLLVMTVEVPSRDSGRSLSKQAWVGNRSPRSEGIPRESRESPAKTSRLTWKTAAVLCIWVSTMLKVCSSSRFKAASGALLRGTLFCAASEKK